MVHGSWFMVVALSAMNHEQCTRHPPTRSEYLTDVLA
jgi:hypothetical protein